MTLNRYSLLVRYAYSLFADYTPRMTSLCAFFWRLIFVTLGWVILLTLVAFLITASCLVLWKFKLGITLVCSIILLSVGAIALFGQMWIRYDLGDSVPIQVVRAVKGKFCPIIDLSNGL